MANETLLDVNQLSNVQGIKSASPLTIVVNPVSTDPIIITNGTTTRTYSAVSGGDVQYAIGTTPADTMINLAAAINGDALSVWNAYIDTGLTGIATTVIVLEAKTSSGTTGNFDEPSTPTFKMDFSQTVDTTVTPNIGPVLAVAGTPVKIPDGTYPTGPTGIQGSAWTFSGAPYLSVTNANGGSIFNPPGDFSVVSVFQTNTTNAGYIIAEKGRWAYQTLMSWYMGWWYGSIVFGVSNDGTGGVHNTQVALSGVTAGNTYVSVLTYHYIGSGTSILTGYINNLTPVSSTTSVGPCFASTDLFYVGGDIANPLNGTVYHTAYYPVCLTAAQIDNIVQQWQGVISAPAKIYGTWATQAHCKIVDYTSASDYTSNTLIDLPTSVPTNPNSGIERTVAVLTNGEPHLIRNSNETYVWLTSGNHWVLGEEPTGISTAVSTTQGILTELTTSLRGTSAAVSTTSSNLLANPILKANTTAVSTIQANITAELVLKATTNAISTTPADLIADPVLISTINGISTTQGTIAGTTRKLEVITNALSIISTNITAEPVLLSTVDGISTTQGTLTQITTSLRGTCPSISQTTATWHVTRLTMGMASVSTMIGGLVTLTVTARSVSDAISSCDGDLTVPGDLHSSSISVSTTQGTLTAEPVLKSTIHSLSTITGNIVNKNLAGATHSNTTTVGSIDRNSGVLVQNDAPIIFSSIVPGGMTEDGLHRYIYIGNGANNSGRGIWAYGRNTITGHPIYIGNYGPLLKNVYSLTNDVRGRFIYACDGQHIYIFEINGIGGLTYLASVTLFSGQIPYIVQTDKTGEFLYCITHGNEFVFTFRLNPSTGFLTLVDLVATGTSAITCTLDCTNRFLYIGCTDGIWVYARNLITGILTFVEIITPAAPLSSLVCDQDFHLFVAEDTVIEKYDITFDTGHLTYASEITSVPHVSVLGIDTYGRFLYALCPNTIAQYNTSTFAKITPNLVVDLVPNGCLTIQNSLYIDDSVSNKLETWHIGGRMTAGSADAISLIAGNVEANPFIDGAAASVTTATGNVCRNPRAVKGISNATTITTGALNGLHQTLQAVVTVVSATNGAVDVPKLLQSTSDSVSTIAGDLIYPISLDSTSASVSTTSGKLTWALDLRSDVISISTAAGQMTAEVPIKGVSTAISTIHSDLLKPCELASVVASVSTAVGDIPVSDYCKSTVPAVSTLVGTLAGLPRVLIGQSDGVSDVIGRLSAECPIASVVQSITTTESNLLAPSTLKTHVNVISTTTGRLRSKGSLKSVSATISSISNTLLRIYRPIKSTIGSISTARTTFYQRPIESICEAESFSWADITLVLKPKSEVYTGRIGFGEYVLPLQPTSKLGIWQSPASVNFTVYRQFVTRFNGYLFDSEQYPVNISEDVVDFVIPNFLTKIGLHLDDINGLVEFTLTAADFVTLPPDLRVVFPFEIYRTTLSGEKYLHITGLLTVEA